MADEEAVVAGTEKTRKETEMADEEAVVETEQVENEGWEALALPPEEPPSQAAAEGGEDVPRETETPTEQPGYLQEGETHEQAVARLGEEVAQARKRASAHYHEQRRQAEEMKAREDRLDRMEQTYAQWVKSFEAEERKKLESQLPDPELEPEKAALTKIDALSERIERMEQQRAAREANANLTAEQRRQAEALQAADSASFQEAAEALGVVEGVGGDEEFKAAWSQIEGQRWRQLNYMYPLPEGKDPAQHEQQLLQGIEMLRALDARKARAQGTSYVNYLRSMHRALFAEPPVNGKEPGHPTVQDLERAAARAGKAAGMRRAPSAGGVKPPPTLEDYAQLSEVEQAKLVAKGEIDDLDLFGPLADGTPFGR